jgi:hypothetical protein
MATSDNYVLTETAYSIVKSALLACGAIDPSQSLSDTDLNTGLADLNRLVKYLQTKKNAPLWKQEEGVLFLDAGKTSYILGPGGDESCNYDDFYSTTTDADELTGQTVISVTATGTIANSDYIGIELDDGTRHWSTISSFVADDTITIADALPSAASSGNTVYTYTSTIPKPLKILDNSRFQRTVSDDEIQIKRWSKQRYMDQTDKTSQGDVVNDAFQPLLSTSTYYVWQPARSCKSMVRFTYYKPIEVFDTTANSPDFPAEWSLPLIYNLAKLLIPQYTVPPEKIQTVMMLAQEYLEDALGFDEEDAPLQVVAL